MMHYRIIIFFFENHHGREWSEKIEFRQVKNHHQREFYVLCIALYYGQNNLSITKSLKFILIGYYTCTVKIEIQISLLLSLKLELMYMLFSAKRS